MCIKKTVNKFIRKSSIKIVVEGGYVLRKNKSIKMYGFLTIEASLLIPLILGIYLFLLFTSFYLYNECVLQQDIYVIGLRGSRFTDWEDGYGEVIYGDISMREQEEITYYIENKIMHRYETVVLPTFIIKDVNIEIAQNTYRSTTYQNKSDTERWPQTGGGSEVRITIIGRSGYFLGGDKEIVEYSQTAVLNPVAMIRQVRREIKYAGN